ncbi:hypothetical protein CKO28_18740 [Rhodovibrio sodomensis]|uniref:Uncharacterized protein n=1 Tax=Rhodovibrio sodomensis TaxID=1088 RepID=A0ABS1DJ94_9PROT|nr:hypothetical protein [Rhodovibrio sodomensis]MBK1670076.1 hypothetical protein [Rhodovibrio sodomensis]
MSICVPQHVDQANIDYLMDSSNGGDALEGVCRMPGVQGEITRLHMANAVRRFDLREDARRSIEADVWAANAAMIAAS